MDAPWTPELIPRRTACGGGGVDARGRAPPRGAPGPTIPTAYATMSTSALTTDQRREILGRLARVQEIVEESGIAEGQLLAVATELKRAVDALPAHEASQDDIVFLITNTADSLPTQGRMFQSEFFATNRSALYDAGNLIKAVCQETYGTTEREILGVINKSITDFKLDELQYLAGQARALRIGMFAQTRQPLTDKPNVLQAARRYNQIERWVIHSLAGKRGIRLDNADDLDKLYTEEMDGFGVTFQHYAFQLMVFNAFCASISEYYIARNNFMFSVPRWPRTHFCNFGDALRKLYMEEDVVTGLEGEASRSWGAGERQRRRMQEWGQDDTRMRFFFKLYRQTCSILPNLQGYSDEEFLNRIDENQSGRPTFHLLINIDRDYAKFVHLFNALDTDARAFLVPSKRPRE